MKKFIVTKDWSGYSRGYTKYEVEAHDEDHAKAICESRGVEIEHDTVRDDTETDYVNVEEVK